MATAASASTPPPKTSTINADGTEQEEELDSVVPRLLLEEATEPVLRAFLEANRPFLLVGVASARVWRATQEWVAAGEEDDFATPDRLVASLGAETRVPVVECGGEGGEYGEEPRAEMALGEYAALWRAGAARAEGLYMKDLHFALRHRQRKRQQQQGEPGPEPYYAVPPPLDDDWLNEWWEDPGEGQGREDDYRFLYLGPAGSRTPMHHDVLSSYSWSANLAGRKRWVLFHPRHTPRLLRAPAGRPGAEPTLVADADSPLLAGVPRLEVEQGPGELLFVPSGWHHQVENLTGCLSLNHNWFNGSALPRVWAFLKGEAAAVRARLRHLEPAFAGEGGGGKAGWARQCEAVLRANAAMGLTEWAGLLVRKARQLLARQGEDHCRRQEQRQKDLVRVLAVLRELRGDAYLLDSLFPAHLEAALRTPAAQEEEEEAEEDVWPPPPPPPQEALRPLVEEWLDGVVAACEAGLAGAGGLVNEGGDGEGGFVIVEVTGRPSE